MQNRESTKGYSRNSFSNIFSYITGFCSPWCDIFKNIYDLGINQHLGLLKCANLLHETHVCTYSLTLSLHVRKSAQKCTPYIKHSAISFFFRVGTSINTKYNDSKRDRTLRLNSILIANFNLNDVCATNYEISLIMLCITDIECISI